MRQTLSAASAALAILLFAGQARAQARSQVQGFGGVTFGTTTAATAFGASVAVPLGSNVQVIAEGGRMTDLKSPLLTDVLDFTPVDVRLSAWYGEAGLRFIASPDSAVRPYFEGTGGFARLTPSVLDAGRVGAVTNAALVFLDSTQPMFGAGAGLMLQGGPFVVDLGYRYTRIFVRNAVASVLTLGRSDIDVNQVRVGVGFRF